MLYVRDIILKCGGTLLYGNENQELGNFSKDTRTINDGDVYVGIKGENFDGNKFYIDAFDKGASACILDNINGDEVPEKYRDRTIVMVENSISCLQALAKYKRSLYNILVIGVTGSVGKTSTKEIIASVLSEKYKTLKTEGNNNNHIGLPLTILRLKDEEAMVLEMGMNNRGEISLLTDIARPSIGVITNIGTAHIGNLGSRENILLSKLEITEGLSGPLIINGDNDILRDNLDKIKAKAEVITFGIDSDSDYVAKNISDNLKEFEIEGNKVESPIGSTAFIYNCLTSYIVGKLCGVSSEEIRRGISKFKLTGSRLNYRRQNGITIIDDSYNASLDSIKSSLEILDKEEGERKIAVIGDILETGTFSRDIHTSVGEELLKHNLDIIITVGIATKDTDKYLMDKGYDKVFHFDTEADSHEDILKIIRSGDVVLFKGSHSVCLGKIVDFLIEKLGVEHKKNDMM